MRQLYHSLYRILYILLLLVMWVSSVQAGPADSLTVHSPHSSASRATSDSLKAETGIWATITHSFSNFLQQAKGALGNYRPGGRTNPVSQELLQVVFYFMATFVLCTFLMLGVILVSRIRRSQALRKYTALKDRYENTLVEVLYSQEEALTENVNASIARVREEPTPTEEADGVLVQKSVTATKTIPATKPKLAVAFDQREIRNPFNRKVLVDLMLDLHKNLSGGTADTLRELYLELGFDKDAMRRLKDSDWSVQAKAVRELSQMDVTEAEPLITKLLNHPNTILVLEVQIALLRLNREKPFAFLDETKIEVTEWQQLSLLTIISHSAFFQVPDFRQWLTSNNNSVVRFAVKMIGYYNQLEASQLLIKQLAHPDQRVRHEVIKRLGSLEVSEAEDTLIERYQVEPEELRTDILLALGKIGTERSLAFLEMVFQTQEFVPSFYAANGLAIAGSRGLERLRLAAAENPNLKKIVSHVEDERI